MARLKGLGDETLRFKEIYLEERLKSELRKKVEGKVARPSLRSDDNVQIANSQIRLTVNQRNWFRDVLPVPMQRQVGERGDNRMLRIHRKLKLNLRIKPKKSHRKGDARGFGQSNRQSTNAD